MAPVLGEYFATGLVPRFPTLIVCACVLVAALLLFISGVILSSQLTKDDRDFEFHLQQVQQWKTVPLIRSAILPNNKEVPHETV